MKKRNIIVCLTVICILILCTVFIYLKYPKYDKNKEYVREYVVGEKGIKGSVDIKEWGDNPAYEIGANRKGYAVFKNPEKAFREMKIDFKKGIVAIQKEYKLRPISRWNFKQYETYGWQLVKTRDAEALAQARKVTGFLDVYENSFKDYDY